MNNPARELKEFWRRMKRIRMVEEAIAEAYPAGEMRCPTHLCIGQEAAGAAAGMALRSDDFAVSSHRAHGHYLGKGGDLYRMLAEIHGKADGCSKGKGGSMHLVDREVGFMGSTAIVGNTIPVGVGLGLSIQLKETDQISCVFLGDGAVEEGVFYESVNFAAVRKLPVLFICENNLYSVYSPLDVRQPKNRSIQGMVEAIGVDGETLTDEASDILSGVTAAVGRVRTSGEPFFIEIPTYRWREHCGPNMDDDLGYRPEEEVRNRKERDPLPCLENELLTAGQLTDASISSEEAAIQQEIMSTFEAVAQAPFPNEEEWASDVYSVTG
jgi:TPP-dependent pyruvate/acetoin dehydrogenase alpha subunit